MKIRTMCGIVSVIAAGGMTIVFPSSALAQRSPTLHAISCAAGRGSMPLAFAPANSFNVRVPGVGLTRRASIIDVGMPEGAFAFQFESERPFKLVVWTRSKSGQTWRPFAVRDAVAAPGGAGFRYQPTNDLAGNSAYRFAMVPADAFQNGPVRMSASWTANCTGGGGGGGATLPPGCGPLSGRGFTDNSQHALRERHAVIATTGGTNRFCIQALGNPNLYSCGLADRGGKGYNFDYTLEFRGETPNPDPRKPARRHYRIAWCNGTTPPEDATLEHDIYVRRPPPDPSYDSWKQLGSTRGWRFY